MRANKFPTSIILLRGTDISSLETDAIRGDLTVSDQIFTDNFDAIQRDELLRDLAQVWLFHRLVQEDDLIISTTIFRNKIISLYYYVG